ncbi:high-affinity choline transporter 1-like isoform X3 [Dermacentor albipictus]|uniref:high-affinity choline transporter 1-like isoform X3 n=1 Tax=Dermacentor albipictus TaxID=60249 RepID=UPI0031FBD117
MTLKWAAAFVAILYYLTVIFVGVWAGRKVHNRDPPERRRRSVNKQGTRTPQQLSLTAGDQYVRNLLVANRSLPLFLSCGSMTGSLLFAGRMRLTDAVTMLDPFQKHYGRWMGLLLALPVVGSEVLWSGAILSSLERQPATPPGDDVSKARTPKQSSPKGSPSPKHPYSLRAGATPTGLGGASPTRDAAAARAAKTPPELSTKGSPASTPAARASGTASPNFPSSTTRPKGAPRAVTTTATKSPLKGVSTSQLLHRTVSHESTSLRR